MNNLTFANRQPRKHPGLIAVAVFTFAPGPVRNTTNT